MDSLIDEILEIERGQALRLDIPGRGGRQFLRQCRDPHGHRRAETDADPRPPAAPATTRSSARLRAQMAWTNLVRGRYKASLEISDKDVEAQLQLHKPDDEKRNRIRIHHAAGHVHRAARLARRRLRSAQTRGRSAARALRQLQRGHSIRARAPRRRGARPGRRSFPPISPRNCATFSTAPQVGHLTPPETPRRACRCSPSATRRKPSPTRRRCSEIREQMFQQKFGAKAKRYLENLRRAGHDRIQDARRQIGDRSDNRAALGIDARRARRDRPRPCARRLASARRTRPAALLSRRRPGFPAPARRAARPRRSDRRRHAACGRRDVSDARCRLCRSM